MAIARFDNLSRDPVDEWIGEGISETLATALGPVVPPGARWRVVGAYQRVGDTLRITARLVDPTTDRPVAVFTIDGPVADLFGLQDELGTRLITAVGEATPALPPSRVPRRVEPTAGTAEFRMPAFTGLHGPPPPVAPEVVTRDASGRVTMRAIRLDAPLELDGQLDERVYVDVDPVTGLIQQEPEEGALATDQTEVWVTFDADTLYISARCWSEEPERIVANAMNRDSFSMYGNETISVVLDTFYDRRNAFGFTTNAVGGLFDSLITDERSQNVDWNTVWDVKVGRFDQGWTVEMAIPFKSLRYRAGGAQIWGVNVQRRVASKNEVSFITPIPASLAWQGLYQMSSAATLTGLEVPDSGSRFEMKPYAISDLSTDLNAAPTVRNNLAGDVGFDAKFGVTSGLTADVTYNTDFAQVEVDEQQVNLTRFSLFFPEKREFFLEGKGIFDFAGGRQGGGPTTFYFGGGQFSGTAPILFFSRRIGLQDGRTVPIRAGGRLTGKAGPYSIGVLNVQTGDELVSGATATNFSVARVKRDILRRSAVGAMFAGRSVALGGEGSNQTFGVDGVFSFFDNVRVTSYLARTQTPGVSGDDTSYQAQFEYGGDRWGLVLDRLAVGDNFNPEMQVAKVQSISIFRNGALKSVHIQEALYKIRIILICRYNYIYK